MKGFQLWLAENREELESKHRDLDQSDINAKGLQMWKELSKEEKEGYKMARVPVATGSSAKRKRDEEDDMLTESSKKAVKTN